MQSQADKEYCRVLIVKIRIAKQREIYSKEILTGFLPQEV